MSGILKYLIMNKTDTNITVDLSKCKKGDILISSHGARLEYISPTPWKQYKYLDHVVRYIEDVDGKSFGEENYGTRTNDGFVFTKNRRPETDHDIIKVETVDKEKQEELLIKMMKADEKDGLYNDCYSYEEMKRCAEFWNQGYIEDKYFKEFLKKEL